MFYSVMLQNNALNQHIKIYVSRDTIFEDSFQQVSLLCCFFFCCFGPRRLFSFAKIHAI